MFRAVGTRWSSEMPIYEYQCDSCEHKFEAMQRLSEDPLKDCPQCGKAELRKLISAAAFVLKGTGWYETDFKDKKKDKETGKDNESDGSKKDDAKSKDGDGKKTESKETKSTDSKKTSESKSSSGSTNNTSSSSSD